MRSQLNTVQVIRVETITPSLQKRDVDEKKMKFIADFFTRFTENQFKKNADEKCKKKTAFLIYVGTRQLSTRTRMSLNGT